MKKETIEDFMKASILSGVDIQSDNDDAAVIAQIISIIELEGNMSVSYAMNLLEDTKKILPHVVSV